MEDLRKNLRKLLRNLGRARTKLHLESPSVTDCRCLDNLRFFVGCLVVIKLNRRLPDALSENRFDLAQCDNLLAAGGKHVRSSSREHIEELNSPITSTLALLRFICRNTLGKSSPICGIAKERVRSPYE